jgi:hypothetical protein
VIAPSAPASGKQVRSQTLERFCVSCANRDQCVAAGTFGLRYGQLHHALGSKDLLVEKRKTVEVASEKGDVIHA